MEAGWRRRWCRPIFLLLVCTGILCLVLFWARFSISDGAITRRTTWTLMDEEWHCRHGLTPEERGTTILHVCVRPHLLDGGGILYPRGPQHGANPKFIRQVEQMFQRDAPHVGNTPGYEAEYLTNGGMLHSYVGGDWSKDFDLDSHRTDQVNGVCVCSYGDGACGLCPGPAKNFSYASDYLSYYGPTWWLPLPDCKNIFLYDETSLLLGKGVQLLPDNGARFRLWYGAYWAEEDGEEWLVGGKYPTIGYKHWSWFRRSCIQAFAPYDVDSNGDITAAEAISVLLRPDGSGTPRVDRCWLAQADRCMIYDTIGWLGPMLKYLRTIDKMESEERDMTKEAPKVTFRRAFSSNGTMTAQECEDAMLASDVNRTLLEAFARPSRACRSHKASVALHGVRGK
jgi:hypothetical protein